MAHILYRMRSLLPPHARLVEGASLSLGLFFLISLVLWCTQGSTHDLSIWLIDLRSIPVLLRAFVVGLCAIGFISFALMPGHRVSRRLAAAASLLVCVFALIDGIRFLTLLTRDAVNADHPIPASALVFGIACWVGWAALRARRCICAKPRSTSLVVARVARTAVVASIAGALLVSGSFVQMLGFGRTDYRRPADAAVVFGSRVYADGTLSLALEDRIRTACDLYDQGLVDQLVVSGGPGDGAIHEVDAMFRFAMDRGVPSSAIVLDYDGLNTLGTLDTVAHLRDEGMMSRFLMVSHGYHLPRVKMECDRRGLQAFTVPAQETRILQRLPWFMAREAAAQWSYLLRPLV